MVSNIEDSTAAGQKKPKQNPKPKPNKPKNPQNHKRLLLSNKT